MSPLIARLRRAARRTGPPAAAFAAALYPTAAAWAQSAPQPNVTNTPPAWVGFLIMAVLAIVVIAISLMPSKRSHQD